VILERGQYTKAGGMMAYLLTEWAKVGGITAYLLTDRALGTGSSHFV
jgi:hypothetical protein